jgi:hypothetical protein
MGLLDRIGAFDRYKVSPTQGTSGLLTGAGQPMSPFAHADRRWTTYESLCTASC